MSEHILERVQSGGPKRILALDGGGVMGLITLGYLEEIEAILKTRSPKGDDFRLCDYFDLIGGTSTGAIIASFLSLGFSAAEIRQRYLAICPKIFARSPWSMNYWLGDNYIFETVYNTKALKREIDDQIQDISENIIGTNEEITLENNHFKTALAVFLKRLDTNSAWVQTNIPGRRYWTKDDMYWWPKDDQRFIDNRNFALKELIRASASAPRYFQEAKITIAEGGPEEDSEIGMFVDGGVSPHNNPSKELFLMSTLRSHTGERSPHALGWPTGADKILLVSVGTGFSKGKSAPDALEKDWLVMRAVKSLRSIIQDGSQDAITWLQAFSEPRKPWRVNGKLKELENYRILNEPLLTYQRFNTRLDDENIEALMKKKWQSSQLNSKTFERLRDFTCASKDNLRRLCEVGETAAQLRGANEHAIGVEADDFPRHFDPESWREPAAL